jgi:hypothetical protein
VPRHAVVVALTVSLVAWLALLPAQAGAQDSSRSPTPQKLWKAYPLDQGAAAGAQQEATTSPTAHTVTKPEPLAAAGPRDEAGAPVIVLTLLVLLAAGGALTFRWTRGGGERQPRAAQASVPRAYTVGEGLPAWAQGGSGRFTPTTARNRGSGATAVVASARTPGGAREPEPATDPPAANPAAVAAPAAAAEPPDRRLKWTAEIEWRHAEGESRFCVIASGAETVTLAQSSPLEWPPSGPAAVEAMTDAVAKLSATLAAAGWKALPPGHSWYAKRFAWEPGNAGRTERAPGGPAGARPQPVRRHRLALLCVVIALGTVVALQLGKGDGDARKAPRAPAEGATATPATGSHASRGTDLTLPLLVLLGVIPVVLVIRGTCNTPR